MKARALLSLTLVCLLTVCSGCGRQGAAQEGQDKLLLAWRSYTTGDFEIALEFFQQVAAEPEVTEDRRFSAVLGLAYTYHLRPNPDYEAALEQYDRLAELGHPAAERLSTLGYASVARARGDTEEALASFRQILEQYPDADEADEAALHIAEMLFSPTQDAGATGGYQLPTRQQVDRGIRVLDERLRRQPDNNLAAVMHTMLAARYVARDNHAKAIEHLRGALQQGISSARTRSTILWQIARIAEKDLRDYALAEQYYSKFVEESERHVLYYRATQSLERVRKLQSG
ncbi:MAG: tetratricopeptide repeat protein [Candidatus Brocadiia bacterium]